MSSPAEQYLIDNLSILRRQKHRDGDELVLRACLFCGRSDKMYINVQKLKFNCYSAHCRARGNITALVMAIEGCSFGQAVEIVGRFASGIIKARPTGDLALMFKALQEGTLSASSVVDLSVPLPPGFRPCYDKDKGTYRVPPYLKARNISHAMIRRWGMGYVTSGRYADRVVIPVICKGMTSFVARDMSGRSSFKYLNPGTLQANFLGGFDRLDPGRPVYVMEGIFDAIRWDDWGYQSCPYFGSHLRDPQIDLLSELDPPEVVVVPDADAYQDVVMRSSHIAHRFKRLKVVKLPPGIDPDTVSHRKEARRLIADALVITGPMDGIKAAAANLNNPWG